MHRIPNLSHFRTNVMNEIFNFLKFYVFLNENKLGKINFLLGEIEFRTHRNLNLFRIQFFTK